MSFAKLIIAISVMAWTGAVAKEARTVAPEPNEISRLDQAEPRAGSAAIRALVQAHAASSSGLLPFALAPFGRERAPPTRQPGADSQTN